MSVATEPVQTSSWVGPTTVLSAVINPGETLLEWAWNQGVRGVSLEKASAPKIAKGNGVHKIVEELVAGRRPTIKSLPVDQRSCAEALFDFWDYVGPSVAASEANVASLPLRVRGRIDLVTRCVTVGCLCDGDGVELFDFKTGSVTDPKSRVQIGSAYPILWDHDRERSGPVCRASLIGLALPDSDKPYDEVEVPVDEGPFLRALRWFRTLEQLGNRTEVVR